jgi:hypothetical protein
MTSQLFEIYADHLDLVVLCATAALASAGICLLLQRILVSAQRHRAGADGNPNEGGPDDDEDRWDWEFDPVREPPSSATAASAEATDPDIQPWDAGRFPSRVRIE